MENNYTKPVEKLINDLSSDSMVGLSSHEVESRQLKYGLNQLKEKKGKSFLQQFFSQFKDVLIIILLIAAAISFGVSLIEKHGFAEPILIVLIVIVNAIIGVIQESKAEKALEALKKMSAPQVKVIRDGQLMVTDSKNLVVGDVIKLDAGDIVPADARLVESSSLRVDESSLTGESVPVEKNSSAIVDQDASIGDRSNMVFSSCAVVYGSAKAVITDIGMETEIGKIADLLSQEKEGQTPLQYQLDKLGKYLGGAALAISVVIFFIGLNKGLPAIEIFMISISLAVAAIPEGLPAIVTVVLALGVSKMAKRNAIVRRLPAVETLGSASVICSDKTGTLTMNQMTLTKLYMDELGIVEDVTDTNSESAKELLLYGTLCSDGNVHVENDKFIHVGDPTETSIVKAAFDNGLKKDRLDEKYPRLHSIPFDSDRKRMSTIVRKDGKNVVIVKGAFDEISKISHSENMQKAERLVNEWASKALRVLAVAIKIVDDVSEDLGVNEIESNLQLIGLVAMIDPPREEAKEAVNICKLAGIKTVMITGDHLITASAIAENLGILNENDKAISGFELNRMSDEELYNEIQSISVFARVSPSDKIRIVKAWQSHNEIVAMTGDGVNDGPALKAADIGCSMGITGTDVAKEASDMTLMDDNFTTIVEAVKAGRNIYDNIKKVVGFLLGTNIGEIFTILFSMVFWQISPLLSMQLLWINLVTDSMPAISLGLEPAEKDIMFRKPKPKNEGIFANGFIFQILGYGFMFSVLTLIGFRIGLTSSGNLEDGRTMAFLVLSLSQVFHSFSMRSNDSLFKIGVFTNKQLVQAFVISVGLTLIIAFVPAFATMFGLSLLSMPLYAVSFGLAIAPVIIVEVLKGFKIIRSVSVK